MKKNIFWKIAICLCVIIVILNIAAFSKSFCDAYKKTVYKAIADCYGYLTGLLPFAIGEIVMYIGALFVLGGLVFTICFIFLHKRNKYKAFFKSYMKSLLLTILVMVFIYTLNWIIPFRGTILGENEKKTSFSTEELLTLRNYIVEELNALSKKVERDKDGNVIYSEDMEEKVDSAMKSLGEKYPILRGYYPKAKKAICSDFLEWMGIGGYTYPYTMEVTFNKYVVCLDYPTLIAHEKAHHKGFYQENEANFISFLSLASSDDYLLQYTAFFEAYYYIDDAYMHSIDMSDKKIREFYLSQPQLCEQVILDEIFSINESEKAYNESVHFAEGLESISEDVAKVGWETQTDILKENSYDGVVLLLLQHYEGELY